MSYRTRRERHQSDSPSKIAVPITPMLDMTFQLLFFFIIIFKPMPTEGVLDTALPSESVTQNIKSKAPDKDRTDSKEEFRSDVTLLVRAHAGDRDQDKNGKVREFVLENNEGKLEPVGSTTLKGLEGFLRKKRESLTRKEAIKIQADSALKVRYLIEVSDTCRKVGLKDISYVTPEDFR